MRPGSKRLVFIACCREKRATASGGSPANKVYAGSLWLTLQAARREADRFGQDWPPAIVLSAKHGFISEDQVIETYDQLLTAELASFYTSHLEYIARLRDLVGDATMIHLAGGRTYLECMVAGLARCGYRGAVSGAAKPRGVGDIRQALARFIADSPRRAAA